MKRATVWAMVLAIVTAYVGLGGSPAMADEALERARYLCSRDGYGYTLLHSAGLDPVGTGSARVYLFYSSASGKNCVVTRKYNLHNIRTPLAAHLRTSDTMIWVRDGPNPYYEYAGPVRLYARGKCVQFYGFFDNLQGGHSQGYMSKVGWCG